MNEDSIEVINNKKPKIEKNNKKLLILIVVISVVIVLLLIIISILLIFNGNEETLFINQLEDKGFSNLNEHFICDKIKKNSKLMMSAREYSFIAIDGEVYNISFGIGDEEKQNCIKRDFETKLKSHIDDIVIGENGKYYSVYENLIEKKDIKFDYDTKNIVQKVDKYILKKDGNIYYQEKPNEPMVLKYKGSSLQGKIQSISLISSEYSDNDERKIIVITNEAIYYSYSENEKKCRKYANTACNYELVKDIFLSKYRNSILYIDDTNIITSDGKVLYTNNYFDYKD